MVGIGFGLLWGSYLVGLYGYSLIRGYCNTFAGLVNPVNPAAWSTTTYTGAGIIPSGCGSAPGTGSSTGTGAIANQAANEASSAGSNVTGGAINPGIGTSQPGSTTGSMGGIGGTGIR
jgi:hypothetical protein